MTSNLGVRYAKYARPIGAIILILLGILLLFFPGWLR
jgi:putative Mn2+ efflux pump MntP